MEVIAPSHAHAGSILSDAVTALRCAADDRARLAWLGDSGQARADHIIELIEAADNAGGSLPPARRLLWTLRRLALLVSRADLAARADYALARHFAQAGRPRVGLALLKRAQQGWFDCGEHIAALRTNLGRMHILTDLGDYSAAVSAGRTLLAGLARLESDPAHAELSGLTWLNIAACENSRGHFSRALRALGRAERFLASGENALALARSRNNRGIALKELGRLEEALDCFAAARPGAAAEPLLSAQLTVNEGKTRLLKGEYGKALLGFERARAELDGLGTPIVRADTLCAVAETYLSLNLYPEALAVYEQLLPFVSRHGISDIEVQAMFGKARVLAGLRRNKQAMEALRQTLLLARGMNNGYMRLLAAAQLAGLLGANGDAPAARELLEQEGLKPAGAPQIAMLALNRARLAADARSARAHLDDAVRALNEAPLPFLRRELLALEGRYFLETGQPQSAIHPLAQAMRLTERLRRGISHEPLLRTFFDDKIEPYRLMLEACLATSNPEAALMTAERAKARSLVEFRPERGTPRDDLPWLELSHIQQRLLEAESSIPLREKRHALVRAERLLGLRLLQDTGASSPLPETERKIEWPSHPVLLYSQTRDRLVYFLCREGEVLHAGTLCGMDELAAQLGDLRDHMERFGNSPVLRQRHGPRMRDHAYRVLSRLYRSVFADVDALLGRPARQRLTVVPHGFLGLLPFSALHDGDGWLVNRYCISESPALGFLKRETGAADNNTAIVASAGFASIPGVEEETAAVADVLNATGAKVHRLSQARVCDVFEGPETPSILHLACHGRFRSDNPMFSGLRLSDRWLTAAEMMERLRYGGRLAVLSACESGRADWLPGNEPLGLPRAFLSAGFQSVVSSLWLADDRTSIALNHRFYEDYAAHGDACRALQTAQSAINCDYDDPFYWAGYVLMGRQ